MVGGGAGEDDGEERGVQLLGGASEMVERAEVEGASGEEELHAGGGLPGAADAGGVDDIVHDQEVEDIGQHIGEQLRPPTAASGGIGGRLSQLPGQCHRFILLHSKDDDAMRIFSEEVFFC